MNVKEIFDKEYESFCEKDPFNPCNIVEGYICKKSTELYGSLLITKINELSIEPQLIMATPKMHYPFTTHSDGTRKYNFPSAKNVEIYEKLDGTNILCFYYTHNEQTYYSAKTRLRPFVGSGKFGNFLDMWKEIANMKEISSIIEKFKCNLSFELYGARNPHLIVYPNILDFALLFGVTNNGKIIPPSEIECNLPKVKKWGVISNSLEKNYSDIREKLQNTLVQTEEGYYSGTEGTVWYLNTIDNKCIQFKCKPEIIEAIHFSSGCRLSKNVIISTCWNAFENTDEPTVEFIKTLLSEEFKSEIIEANHDKIKKCLSFVKNEVFFRQNVIDIYHKSRKNVLVDKPSVMKHMSQFFNKKDMRKVYSIIINFG